MEFSLGFRVSGWVCRPEALTRFFGANDRDGSPCEPQPLLTSTIGRFKVYGSDFSGLEHLIETMRAAVMHGGNDLC